MKMLAPAAALLAATTVYAADELPIKPGLWQTTTTIEHNMFGQTRKDTRTQTECVKEEAFNPERMVPDADKCRILEQKLTGNRLTYKMHCNMDGAETLVEGVYESSGNHGKGSLNMTVNAEGMSMSMRSRFSGEWVGDC